MSEIVGYIVKCTDNGKYFRRGDKQLPTTAWRGKDPSMARVYKTVGHIKASLNRVEYVTKKLPDHECKLCHRVFNSDFLYCPKCGIRLGGSTKVKHTTFPDNIEILPLRVVEPELQVTELQVTALKNMVTLLGITQERALALYYPGIGFKGQTFEELSFNEAAKMIDRMNSVRHI